MTREEDQETMTQRGEMIKFLILVLVLVGTVFAVALLRPLIFEQMVPAVLGWEGEQEGLPATAPATEAPAAGGPSDEIPLIMTATAPAEGAAAGNGGAPLPTPRVHEVQAGDTLEHIAARYTVSVEALAKANAISDPQRIQVGDVLIIPQP